VFSVDRCGPKGHDNLAQGLPHARQHKVLVLEFEGFDRFLSTKDEGVFIFDERNRLAIRI
jgi:hypothetical protein